MRDSSLIFYFPLREGMVQQPRLRLKNDIGTGLVMHDYNEKRFHARVLLACPFFMPDQRLESDWPFPHRLPLAAGWSGTCAAFGHVNERPSNEELKSACNLGYARNCHRLPQDRRADAVRFALGEEQGGALRVLYTMELNYLPAGSGELTYDIAAATWREKHSDSCLQRMAECYVEARGKRRDNVLVHKEDNGQ